tara:strand:+ start:117 stop:413 length:297 start_codon:yes stop_codon:yes gene_type:complete
MKKLTNAEKLKQVRNKIDKIDNKLLPLIIHRSKLVNLALATKIKKSEIIDQKRIKNILNKVHKEAKAKKVDPILIKKIWKTMIWNFIDFENKEFKKRK